MKSVIPFGIKLSPIKKLALIPFEKSPEKLYRGFELQYIEYADGKHGYRVLGYRNDNYVDVYDDPSLPFDDSEEFNVVENGLNKHVQTKIENVVFENRGGRQVLGFEFKDIEDRAVEFYYEEKTSKKTTPMNLLAPIGLGSKEPQYLPLFFMYDFDFMRRKAEVRCIVDGKSIRLDKFPFPMNCQARSYVRYSNYCELLEFARAEDGRLIIAELDGDMTCCVDGVTYRFDTKNVLEAMAVPLATRALTVSFEPALDMNSTGEGAFKILPDEKMGYLSGRYSVSFENEQIQLKLLPVGGWTAVPTSFVSKMVLSKNSVFSTWSKNYEYHACFDMNTGEVNARWENNNIDSKGQ